MVKKVCPYIKTEKTTPLAAEFGLVAVCHAAICGDIIYSHSVTMGVVRFAEYVACFPMETVFCLVLRSILMKSLSQSLTQIAVLPEIFR